MKLCGEAAISMFMSFPEIRRYRNRSSEQPSEKQICQRDWLVALAGIGLCTGAGFLMFPNFALVDIAMVYILAS